MVGLVQHSPSALLVFVAGHAADRYDRRRVAQFCQIVQALTGVFLAWGNVAGWLSVTEIFAALLVMGTAKAFENPAVAALLPGVAPRECCKRHYRAFERRVSGCGHQRSGAGRVGLRAVACRALRTDGALLAAGGYTEWHDQARPAGNHQRTADAYRCVRGRTLSARESGNPGDDIA